MPLENKIIKSVEKKSSNSEVVFYWRETDLKGRQGTIEGIYFRPFQNQNRKPTFGPKPKPKPNRHKKSKLHMLISVSYTHLRAHETRHDLVCRLLLEKKKVVILFLKMISQTQSRNRNRKPTFGPKPKPKPNRYKKSKPHMLSMFTWSGKLALSCKPKILGERTNWAGCHWICKGRPAITVFLEDPVCRAISVKGV